MAAEYVDLVAETQCVGVEDFDVASLTRQRVVDGC